MLTKCTHSVQRKMLKKHKKVNTYEQFAYFYSSLHIILPFSQDSLIYKNAVRAFYSLSVGIIAYKSRKKSQLM